MSLARRTNSGCTIIFLSKRGTPSLGELENQTDKQTTTEVVEREKRGRRCSGLDTKEQSKKG